MAERSSDRLAELGDGGRRVRLAGVGGGAEEFEDSGALGHMAGPSEAAGEEQIEVTALLWRAGAREGAIERRLDEGERIGRPRSRCLKGPHGCSRRGAKIRGRLSALLRGCRHMPCPIRRDP